MTDLAKTIAPKSDQLNADDLIAGPRTITITKVRGCDEADQPIAIHFEGDDNKPFKPGKSMRRVMVHCWGPDGNTYVGHRLSLYRDEGVAFGGIKVGGIRISHMSHIDRDITMALTVTRAQRKPYTVKPLRADVRPGPQPPRAHRDDVRPGDDDQAQTQARPPAQPPSTLTLDERAAAFLKRAQAATTNAKLDGIWGASEGLRSELDAKDPERLVEITEAFDNRRREVDALEAEEPA